MLSFSEPWSIIEFSVLFITAVIVALRGCGERLPEIITERVPAVFRSRRWATVPLMLIGVYLSLLILQRLGVVPEDGGEIPNSPSAAPRSDENGRRVAALQSELHTTKRELESATQALETARQAKTSPSSVTVNLTGVGAIEVPYIRNMGPVTTLNRFSLAKEKRVKLASHDTVFLITSPRENMILKYGFEMLLDYRAYKNSATPEL
jgi:hypothetical protein